MSVGMEISAKDIKTSEKLKIYPTFKSMNLKPEIEQGICHLGYTKPSAIQQRAIVPIIEGNDVIAQSQSGTGKTATFSIALLQRLDIQSKKVQAIMLSPTRELASQTHKVVQSLGSYRTLSCHLLIGGNNDTKKDVQQLRRGQQVVSGTPGKMFDMIKQKHMNTKSIKMLILDEADEMLGNSQVRKTRMNQIYGIFKSLPAEVQVVVSSATLSNEVMEVVSRITVDPVKILVPKDEISLEGIKQYVIDVVKEDWKLGTITDIYDKIRIDQAIIFCNSKKRVDWLTKKMKETGFVVSSMHGEVKQKLRDSIMNDFRSGKTRVLITTDIWARGIDVQQVSHVFNYDLPVESAQYIHRIGRSGRFGRTGVAINLVRTQDKSKIKALEKYYKIRMEVFQDPDA